MLAGVGQTRARFLDRGITRLLGDDKGLKDEVYKHPLIRSFSANETSACPSYIPARTFATALMDVLSGPEKSPTDIDALLQGIQRLNEQPKKALSTLLKQTDS